MFQGGAYVSAGPPVWAIIVAVPFALWLLGAAVYYLGGPPPAGRRSGAGSGSGTGWSVTMLRNGRCGRSGEVPAGSVLLI